MGWRKNDAILLNSTYCCVKESHACTAAVIRTEYCISKELHTTGNRLGLSIASFKSSVDGNGWGKQPELQMEI